MIKEFLKLYVKTGSTKTPTRGRGQRISKKNPLYEESSDEEKENCPLKVRYWLQDSVISRYVTFLSIIIVLRKVINAWHTIRDAV